MAITTKEIKLSEFSSMTEDEKRNRANELFKIAVNPSEKQIQEDKEDLDSQINYFESLYQMSSDKMKELLQTGKLTETTEICEWLFILKMRGYLESKYESSQAKCL